MDPTAQTALSLSEKAMTLVGKLFGPLFTRRQADANARAELQAVLTEQVATYMESHPNDPMMLEALIECGGKTNFQNLARIMQKAMPQLTDDARPDQISDDWAANFKDKARTCSDPDMAELWAQLIAGEANASGSYSRKTVNMLADLEPGDARLFRSVSMFRMIPANLTYSKSLDRVTEIRPQLNKRPALLILDSEHSIYTAAGINFASLSRLEWLGLITSSVTGYEMSHTGPGLMIRSLGNELLFVVPSDKSIGLGEYQLTPAGEELSKLCTPLESPDGFADYIVSVWKSRSIPATRSMSAALAMNQQAQSS